MSGIWGQGCLRFLSQSPGFERQSNAMMDRAILASPFKKMLRACCASGENCYLFLYRCFFKTFIFKSRPCNRLFSPHQLSWVKYTASPVCSKMPWLPRHRWCRPPCWFERLLFSLGAQSPLANIRKQVSNCTNNHNQNNYYLFLRA